MNIYSCWYQGLCGYCFEHPRSGWWFVPETGQPQATIHRHLQLRDFVFNNPHDWAFECRRQQQPQRPFWRRLFSISSSLRPHTVAGLLLMPLGHQ